MAPDEALYRRPYRSPVCWTEVGERPTMGPNLVKDTSEKVDLIWKRLLMLKASRRATPTDDDNL